MAPLITGIQTVLLLGGVVSFGFGALGWVVAVVCAVAIVVLQRYKLHKIDPKTVADPNNRRRGTQQAIILSAGCIGFLAFWALDGAAHIDTTGAPLKHVVIAGSVALLFILVGLSFTLRRKPGR